MISTWVLTDGKAGTENQCVGLAEALNVPFSLKKLKPVGAIRVLPSQFWTLPLGQLPIRLLSESKGFLSEPWPKLLIAAGKTSVGVAIAVRRKSRGKTFVVQLQNPRVSPRFFDLVVPPRHDGVVGENVYPTRGALNRVTDDLLKKAMNKYGESFMDLPKPLVAMLVGGDSRHYRTKEATALKLARSVKQAVGNAGAGLLITFSRRTRPGIKKILEKELCSANTIIWNGRGDNPYLGFLACADYIIVTEDSISMTSEAASTGKPVYIAQITGGSEKFKSFHRELLNEGVTRIFAGRFDLPWHYDRLNDTYNTANLIKKKLSTQYPKEVLYINQE